MILTAENAYNHILSVTSKLTELRSQYKALEGRIDCDEDLSILEHHAALYNVPMELITMSDEDLEEFKVEVMEFFKNFNL